jgi:flagellar protein FlaG
MDVSASRPVAPPDTQTRRFVRAPAAPPEADPRKAPQIEHPSRRFEAHSLLKFNVAAADVDAKFEIHKATSRVTVTMYERETGEVLREIPSRRVLDAIASVTESGLHVDTSS